MRPARGHFLTPLPGHPSGGSTGAWISPLDSARFSMGPSSCTTGGKDAPTRPARGTIMVRTVSFTNRAVEIAAHLHLPDDFTEDKQYPALVGVHPAGGVKEQTIG